MLWKSKELQFLKRLTFKAKEAWNTTQHNPENCTVVDELLLYYALFSAVTSKTNIDNGADTIICKKHDTLTGCPKENSHQLCKLKEKKRDTLDVLYLAIKLYWNAVTKTEEL